jgi:hypothetical protein
MGYVKPPSVFGHSQDAEMYSGAHETREEAIAEGNSEYGGSPFFTAEAEYPDPAAFLPSAVDIREQMEEALYDHEMGGEWAEGWPSPNADSDRELDSFLEGWARRNHPTSWYSVSPGTVQEHDENHPLVNNPKCPICASNGPCRHGVEFRT